MRPAHFIDISSDRGKYLLSTIARVNTLAAEKNRPQPLLLSGGNLFAAVMKAGGHRLIAVGETQGRILWGGRGGQCTLG